MVSALSAIVVDVDSRSRDRVAQFLRERVSRVLTAADAQSAIAAAHDAPIDLLFTELRLTHDDGISLICALRRLWPRMQAVVVTGHASLETSIEALRHRVADFVIKPASDLKISSALERALKCRARAAEPLSDAERQTSSSTPRLHIDPAHGVESSMPFTGNLREIKLRMVRDAIFRSHGNKAAAALALGISRRTLYRILRDHAQL